MVKRSIIDLQAGAIGGNVAVYRGRGDPRNILGVVVNKTDIDQYKLAMKFGQLNGHCSRNQFDICPQRLLFTDDVWAWTTQFLFGKPCQVSLLLEVKASSNATAVVPSVGTQIAASVSRQN